MNHFVSFLESAIDGTRLDAGKIQTLHKDRPIWVRYDLETLKRNFTKEDLLSRPSTIWRYKEMLPVRDRENIVSLGEGMTPNIGAFTVESQERTLEMVTADIVAVLSGKKPEHPCRFQHRHSTF